MTSKWIEDLDKELDLDPFYGQMFSEGIHRVAERIDKLLRLSMHETDNENLSDMIRKEINGTS